jgi:hypothetical protein
MSQILERNFSFWEETLKDIYGAPASVSTVTGEWKSGKTNFALYLSFDELMQTLNLVNHVGTNVKVFKNYGYKELDERISYIDNFNDLEVFLFQDRKPKAFIYDEAIKSTPSRKAMSQMNTKWLEYVPELSKARCHLIVVTQAKDYTESVFLNPVFNRTEWHKISKTSVELRKFKPKMERLKFHDVPSTSLIYDPYGQAVWKLQAELKYENLPMAVKIMFEYGHGLSGDELKEKYQLASRTTVMRKVQEGIRLVEQLLVSKLQGAERGNNTIFDDTKTSFS